MAKNDKLLKMSKFQDMLQQQTSLIFNHFFYILPKLKYYYLTFSLQNPLEYIFAENITAGIHFDYK